MRRKSVAKEVTAKSSECFIVNIVFKRLDRGDVKILNRALEKNVAQTNLSTKLNIAVG